MMTQDHPNMPPEGWAWPNYHWDLSHQWIKTSDVFFHCYVKNVIFTPNLTSASFCHSSPWSVCAGWIALDYVFPDECLWAESPVGILSVAPSITWKNHIQGSRWCCVSASPRVGFVCSLEGVVVWHWSDILHLWRENKEERVVFPWELIKEMFTYRHVGESFWLFHKLTWTWC